MGKGKGDIMTLHAITQYIKYRWKAKNRHGIHSPFVYAFIEDGLMKLQGDTPLQTIYNYFPGKNIVEQNIGDAALTDSGSNTVIVVKNIHADTNSTAGWDALKTNDAVRLSIDMYSLGLLFFNADVKEQQHFIIKYPL